MCFRFFCTSWWCLYVHCTTCTTCKVVPWFFQDVSFECIHASVYIWIWVLSTKCYQNNNLKIGCLAWIDNMDKQRTKTKYMHFRIFCMNWNTFTMWLLLLIASQYMPDLLLSMRTFCMRRPKWYMISLLALGVPIIDGASLRQFCTSALNISSKVSCDLRLQHFVDQKSVRFYILILRCRRPLEHDTWHLVWWVFHHFPFHTDNCQCPL